MITKKQYNELRLKIENLERLLNGGKGSGNWGHSGRPGEVGGSASKGAISSGRTIEEIDARYKKHSQNEKEYLEAAEEFRAEGQESDAAQMEQLATEEHKKMLEAKKDLQATKSQGAELYKKIGESQKRAEKQEAIVKGFEKAAKAMDKLEKAFKKAKAGGSKADLAELVYDAQERVTDLYFLDDMKKADQKDRADYDKKQRELAVEIYKFTTGKEPKKMPPSRDKDIHFWGY